jgi:alkylation response protein AidB-like acyl-CoA dehydrogenase
VPAKTKGVKVEEYMWTFNMPTDHPRVSFTDVFVADDALFGEIGRGLSLAQCFVHENRIRQAASSLGAAVYCIQESVKYARERKPFGRALAENQAIQWPLVELATQAEMLRLLIRKTAWEMDQLTQAQVEHTRSPTRFPCAITGRTGCAARRPTAPCRSMAAWATRATSRSSTSTAITVATASQKAARKSRNARSRDFCSAIWGQGSIE